MKTILEEYKFIVLFICYFVINCYNKSKLNVQRCEDNQNINKTNNIYQNQLQLSNKKITKIKSNPKPKSNKKSKHLPKWFLKQ